MDGTVLRIENSSRGHAESLHRLLRDYETNLVRHNGTWQVEVGLGESGGLLQQLFATLGSWLDAEQVDSLVLHFEERQYSLLRPSDERSHNSHAALLERVAQLETALATRVTVEQAKGILARALGISPEDAFTVLRKAARDKGTRLRDLADRIVASPGEAEAVLASAIHESS